MTSNNESNSADQAIGALLVHVATSIGLLQAVGVPAGGIAKAFLSAAVAQGRAAIGPREFAAVLRGLADQIDAEEALRASRAAGSA